MTENNELTPRTRFVRHALFEPVDRPPYIATHGFWPQTVERWHGEGLPNNVRHKNESAEFQPGDTTIEEYFQQEVYFGEDMAYKNGPLIGPDLAGEFIFPYYRELIQEMKRLGLRVFCLDTDGNAQALMDRFVEVGINNFLPCEIAAGMEPAWLSDRYGHRCSIQGGIDNRVLSKGKAEIEAEVMRKAPTLLARGGYIPGVDHSVPNDIPFANFCYLVELLRRLGRDIQPVL